MWHRAGPWAGLVARLGLAAVWLYAGGSKAGDLAGSARAVNAYQLLPFDVAQVIGAMLPFVEVAVGLLLLAGLATRVSAVFSALLLVVFIVGIASAWARGLQIDCGCFGSGGQLAAGESPTYGWEITRDIGFLLLAGYLIVRPDSRFSVDRFLTR
ncbi:putative membrane protein YphA (DoxX/SURF4 family) [Catenuloplanes nepalensis]|uniref:Membrane protein YphA (DoxX/SURF4 family) n=1 Tax=Catenuloplanes nepalensis TaxID=587533 RepID=A0ABT9N7P1_9ACTN|nr:MauE/DoxX family redox-associated membrane protein [Catenuloplanes nepalensis]MDP9799718.1 putative membrane protein YphA (DoxX/SURF4 family) [Catenuloplanes nepalensis]